MAPRIPNAGAPARHAVIVHLKGTPKGVTQPDRSEKVRGLRRHHRSQVNALWAEHEKSRPLGRLFSCSHKRH
ncbi:hypothetical protein THIX_60374 [Thiomonas sp. X19]|nr:hypothetical protein THIX_60374 [Thiomonas sp. X19]